MATELSYTPIVDFNLGLITKIPARRIPINSASDSLNVRSKTGLEVLKRTGYSEFNSTALGNTWTAKTAMNTARQELAGFYIGSDGYSVGGDTGAVSAVTEIYDVVANTWTAKTAMATAREGIAGFNIGNYGYAVAGTTGTNSNVTEQYDSIGNSWATKATINTARSFLSAFVIKQFGFIAGGYVAAVSAVTEVYDSLANAWTAKASLNTARQYLCGYTIDNKGYAVGGTTGSDSAVNEQYDYDANTWTAKGAITAATNQLTGFSISPYGFIAGGDADLTTTRRYDPDANSWSAMTSMNTGREKLASFTVGGGYTCGGYIAAVSAVTEVYASQIITGIYHFLRKDGVTKRKIVSTPSNIYYWNDQTSAWTSLIATLTAQGEDYPSFATFLDYLLVANGKDSIHQWNTSENTYDMHRLATNIWAGLASMSTASLTLVSAFATATYGYSAGGDTGSVSVVTEQYDKDNNKWSTKANMNTARRELAAFSINNYGYTVGGDTGSVSAVTEEYNETANTWIAKGNLNTARETLSAAYMNNDLSAVSAGGYIAAVSAVTETFVPGTNTWTAKTAMNTARQQLCAFSTTKDTAYTAGGTTGTVSAVLELYDVNANTHTAKLSMTTARSRLAGFNILIDKLGYTVGGWVSAASAVNEQYNATQNSWSTKTALGTATADLSGFSIDRSGYVIPYGSGTAKSVQKFYGGSTESPKVKYVIVHKNYLFGANTTDNPSNLYWSALNDPENWDVVTNYQPIHPQDGEAITELAVINDVLHIFKRNRIFKFPFTAEPSDGMLVPYEVTLGCVSARSIVNVDGLTFFLSEQGVFSLSNEGLKYVSDQIETTVQGLNQGRLANSFGVHMRKFSEYWLFCCGSGKVIPDTTLVYNYRLNHWSKFNIVGLSAGILPNYLTGIEKVYVGKGNGKIYLQDDTNNDDGSAINGYWQTGWIDMGQPQMDKSFRRLYTWVKSSGSYNVTLDVYKDYDSTTADLSSTISVANLDRIRNNLNTIGEIMMLKFSNNTAAQTFELDGFSIGVTGKSVAR